MRNHCRHFFPHFKPNMTRFFFLHHRTYPALETLTEPHQLTATLSCMIGVARSLVSGGQRFPEGPTHMLPLLMRALPGVDPNDFSKCMVRSRNTFIVIFRWVWFCMSCPSFPVSTDHIPVHCNVCDACAFGGLFVHPPRKNGSDRGETRVLLWRGRGLLYQEFTNNYIPCVLGWERDVLSISWVWRFCAAVYGQVPVCSHLSLLVQFLASTSTGTSHSVCLNDVR